MKLKQNTFKVARHNTSRHDSHGTSCFSCRDVPWRDATSGIWALNVTGQQLQELYKLRWNDCFQGKLW